MENGIVGKEYDEGGQVGEQRGNCLPLSFYVSLSLYEGYFAATFLADGDIQHIWIVRTESDPNCYYERPNFIMIQHLWQTL